MAKPATTPVDNAVDLAWLQRARHIHVLADRKDEINGLGLPKGELEKLDLLLDKYSKVATTARHDVDHVVALSRQQAEAVEQTLIVEADAVNAEAESDCQKWILANFQGPKLDRMIASVVKSMGGYDALRSPLIADHLTLIKVQRVEINRELSRHWHAMHVLRLKKGVKEMVKSKDYIEEIGINTANVFEILTHEQVNAWLVLRGYVKKGEGVGEFLHKMRPDLRDRLLGQSKTLAEAWRQFTLPKPDSEASH